MAVSKLSPNCQLTWVIAAVAGDFVTIGFLIPILQFYLTEDVGMSIHQFTWCKSCVACAQLIAGVCLTWMSDAVGRRPVFVASTFWEGVFYWKLARSTTVQDAAFSYILTGFSGSVKALAQSIICDLTAPGPERARRIGFIGAGIGAGMTLGPLIAAYTSKLMTHRQGLFIPAGIHFVISLFSFLFVEESLPKEKRSHFWQKTKSPPRSEAGRLSLPSCVAPHKSTSIDDRESLRQSTTADEKHEQEPDERSILIVHSSRMMPGGSEADVSTTDSESMSSSSDTERYGINHNRSNTASYRNGDRAVELRRPMSISVLGLVCTGAACFLCSMSTCVVNTFYNFMVRAQYPTINAPTAIGHMMCAAGVVMFVVQGFLFRRVFCQLGPFGAAFFGCGGLGIGVVIIRLSTAFSLPMHIFLVCATYSVAYSIAEPTLPTLISLFADSSHQGLAQGVLTGNRVFAKIVGPPLFSIFFEISSALTFTVAGGCAFLSLLPLSLAFLRRHSSKEAMESKKCAIGRRIAA